MVSHSTVLFCLDMLVLVGGMLVLFCVYGQIRLPVKKGHPSIFLLQLILMSHFFLRVGIDANRPSSGYLFYIEIVVGLIMFMSVFYQYIRMSRQTSN
jgi:hypothetical protein